MCYLLDYYFEITLPLMSISLQLDIYNHTPYKI